MLANSGFARYLTKEEQTELVDLSCEMLVPGKGFHCADGSISTCGRGFEQYNIQNTEENRRRFREVLYTADNFLKSNVSCIALLEEATRQCASSGVPFVRLLQQKGIIVGVTINMEPVVLPDGFQESAAPGLDGLRARCARYKNMGIQFAVWKCVFNTSPFTPSYLSLIENANTLGRFAAICQQVGMVAIIEPDIVYNGDYDLFTAQCVAEEVLAFIYKAMIDHHVLLEGTYLKICMVSSGLCFQATGASLQKVAAATMKCVLRTVPPAVAGIIFVSGGECERSAADNLNAISATTGRRPWSLAFAYGDFLKDKTLQVWQGKDENLHAAQKALHTTSTLKNLSSIGWIVEVAVQKVSLLAENHMSADHKRGFW